MRIEDDRTTAISKTIILRLMDIVMKEIELNIKVEMKNVSASTNSI